VTPQDIKALLSYIVQQGTNYNQEKTQSKSNIKAIYMKFFHPNLKTPGKPSPIKKWLLLKNQRSHL
jgi:hypothetical protein